MAPIRVLVWVAVTVAFALVAPSFVLSRVPGLWPWLMTADPASDLSVLGALRSADPDAVDVVVLGSSVAGANVSPWVMERDGGLRTINAGVLSMSPLSSAMYVDDALRLTPHTVVLVTGPRSLSDTGFADAGPFDWSIAAASLPPARWVRADTLYAALSDLSLLVRLRSVPRLAWDGDLADIHRHPSVRPKMFGESLATALAFRQEQLATSPVVPGGVSSRAVSALIRRCEAADTDVLLVAAPMHPDLIGTGAVYTDAHLTELRAIASGTHARLLIPDGDWVDDDFRDPTHLSRTGQVRFTRQIIEAL